MYLDAEMPDQQSPALRRAADQLRNHANACHHAELRRLASQMSGLDPEDILDSRLVFLGMYGFELNWIDIDGAHTVVIHFGEPAVTAMDIAVRFGRYLLDT